MNSQQCLNVLDNIRKAADSFLDISDVCVADGDLENAMKATQTAAWLLGQQNRELFCERIEKNFRIFGNAIPVGFGGSEYQLVDPGAKPVCLHVITEALPYGGHTAMALRWISEDAERVHSVALLAQREAVPEELVDSVRKSGGLVYRNNSEQPLLPQSAWLRGLANRVADYIVLHVDVHDVIAPTAFAVDGGPPVMLVNHAAHVFWAGASVVDLVVNCRGSRLEAYWSHMYRGGGRCATIPIPLLAPPECCEAQRQKLRREEMRATLGIPLEAVVILSMGDSYKFSRTDRLDFISVCEELLEKLPDLFVVVVGPEVDSRWIDAAERSNYRLRSVGRQASDRILMFHAVADIYIEGFPFGSTTALLEAGLRKLPVVLAPIQCPPPYGSDGVALDDVLTRPLSIKDYQEQIICLVQSRSEREHLGVTLYSSVIRHHTGKLWRGYVDRAIAALNAEHRVQLIEPALRTPDEIYEYWADVKFKASTTQKSICVGSVGYFISIGGVPRLERYRRDRTLSGHSVDLILEMFVWYYWHINQVSLAKGALREAFRRQPWKLRVWIRLGLLSLGKVGLAMVELQRVIRKGCRTSGAVKKWRGFWPRCRASLL